MNLLERSFVSSIIILVVIISRILLLNKLPKKTFMILWYIVLFRLLVPYSFSSVYNIYSLIEQCPFRMDMIKERIENDNRKKEMQEMQEIQIEAIEKNTDNMVKKSIWKDYFSIWRVIWFIGMIIFAVIFLFAYIFYYRKFRTSLLLKNEFITKWLKSHNIRRKISIKQSERIVSPLTYGVFKPVILIPKGMKWENIRQMEYILEHEFIHIKRLDAVTKFCSAFAICIHWFNPFVWLLYFFINKDIELCCDEAVVRHFGEDSRSSYALTLISMEEVKSEMMPLGNGFYKNPAEERIVAIMKIKNTSMISYMLAIILISSIFFAFATSPVSLNQSKEDFIVKQESLYRNYNINAGIMEKEEKDSKGGENKEEENTYQSILGEIMAGIVERGDYEVLKDFIYILRKEDLHNIIKQIIEKGDKEALEYIIPYIDKDKLKEMEGRI